MGANITVAAFISLFVCLIPTTIGGLLSAIGIAGMDRALRANVITKSGKAIETAGDIDTLLLDKTGTITIGKPQGHALPSRRRHRPQGFRAHAARPSPTPTPKAKLSSSWAPPKGVRTDPVAMVGVRMVKFTAETKCSGVDMPDGRRIRKGAAEAIFRIAAEHENPCPAGNRSHRAHHLRERRHTAHSLRKRTDHGRHRSCRTSSRRASANASSGCAGWA